MTPDTDTDLEGLVERLKGHSIYHIAQAAGQGYSPFSTATGHTELARVLDEAASALTFSEQQRKKAEGERDEALADCDDYRERLHDLVMIDSEEWAAGGGPGFKERKQKAWTRAREPFEP